MNDISYKLLTKINRSKIFISYQGNDDKKVDDIAGLK